MTWAVALVERELPFDMILLADIRYIGNQSAHLLYNHRPAAERGCARHYLFENPRLQRAVTPFEYNQNIMEKYGTPYVDDTMTTCAGTFDDENSQIACPANRVLNTSNTYLEFIAEDERPSLRETCVPCVERISRMRICAEDVDGMPSCDASRDCNLAPEVNSPRCMYHPIWDDAPLQPYLAGGDSAGPQYPPPLFINPTPNFPGSMDRSFGWLKQAWLDLNPKVWVLDNEFCSLEGGMVLPYEIAKRNLKRELILDTKVNYRMTLQRVIQQNTMFMNPWKQKIELGIIITIISVTIIIVNTMILPQRLLSIIIIIVFFKRVITSS